MSNLLFALFLLFIYVEAQKPLCMNACGKNQVYTKCEGALACQESCTNKDTLPLVKCACVKGCKCKDGYVRHQYTNECILKSECANIREPKCRNLNEGWSDSAAGCQKSCATLSASLNCTSKAGCICKPGFVRETENPTSPCVYIEQCKTGCPKGYIKNKDGLCELDCNECPKRYEIRNDVTGLCECPPTMTRNSSQGECVCPSNEAYSCGNPKCEPTCNTLGKPCTIAIFRCEDKCYCMDGFVRDTRTKSCVSSRLCLR